MITIRFTIDGYKQEIKVSDPNMARKIAEVLYEMVDCDDQGYPEYGLENMPEPVVDPEVLKYARPLAA